ncbi:ras-related protein Rab-28 [Harpegnathos saltator]|uniref:Ras-related protein Rab-28 n=1 Tax=Harpegnathos saltator TaxID=610380 RepID=E2CAA0_HARSA|nr:ras-related protein Rab-28 [Harpegnathos saltator]EFN75149.1 Ras-related protein Rab-28 [Harpegnathos saltator]
MSDIEEDSVEKRLKIVLVGDSGAGKTSIVQKFCNNDFARQYVPTAGIDFFLKNLTIGGCKNVNLHLWDVGGLALHGNMLDKYIFGAHIILLVYDVTNSSSFEILEEWLSQIRNFIDAYDEPLIALVGNKCDMEHQRTVKRDRSHRFAAENGFPYHDMSARTGESVSLCVASLAAQVLGVRLTRTDQDFHKPIIIAEIGDTVDMTSIHKVVKRIPNKKQYPIAFNPHFPSSKSAVCTLQ